MEITKAKAQFLSNVLTHLLPNMQIAMTIPDAINFDKLRLELIADLQPIAEGADEAPALELADTAAA